MGFFVGHVTAAFVQRIPRCKARCDQNSTPIITSQIKRDTLAVSGAFTAQVHYNIKSMAADAGDNLGVFIRGDLEMHAANHILF